MMRKEKVKGERRNFFEIRQKTKHLFAFLFGTLLFLHVSVRNPRRINNIIDGDGSSISENENTLRAKVKKEIFSLLKFFFR